MVALLVELTVLAGAGAGLVEGLGLKKDPIFDSAPAGVADSTGTGEGVGAALRACERFSAGEGDDIGDCAGLGVVVAGFLWWDRFPGGEVDGAGVAGFLWWDRFPAGEVDGAGDSEIGVDSLGLVSAAAFL